MSSESLASSRSILIDERGSRVLQFQGKLETLMNQLIYKTISSNTCMKYSVSLQSTNGIRTTAASCLIPRSKTLAAFDELINSLKYAGLGNIRGQRWFQSESAKGCINRQGIISRFIHTSRYLLVLQTFISAKANVSGREENRKISSIQRE